MYSQLSVFDLDHTLLTANSSFRFGCYLYREKEFSWFPLFCSLFHYMRHKWFNLSVEEVHYKIFEALFKGRSKQDIERLARLFLGKNLNAMLYGPVLRRLQEAQQQGHYVVLLSSSPDFLVKPIVSKLNISEYQATIYGHDASGCFNCISSIVEGSYKAEYIRSLASKLHIPTSRITAYSDSYLDLPILKMAGKAIGVIPDRYLRRICIEQGWEIIN